MQFPSIAVFLSALAAVAVAQNPPTPPACALSCLATTSTNGCDLKDITCLCKNVEFLQAQAACITAACPKAEDLQQAEAFARTTCLSVSITLPAATPPATGASSATAPASSASATAPRSSAAAAAPSSSPTSAAASVVYPPIALLAGVAACALAL